MRPSHSSHALRHVSQDYYQHLKNTIADWQVAGLDDETTLWLGEAAKMLRLSYRTIPSTRLLLGAPTSTELMQYDFNEALDVLAEVIHPEKTVRQELLFLAINILVGIIANLPGRAYASVMVDTICKKAGFNVKKTALFSQWAQNAFHVANTSIQVKTGELVYQFFISNFLQKWKGYSTKDKFVESSKLLISVLMQAAVVVVAIDTQNASSKLTGWWKPPARYLGDVNRFLQLLRSSMLVFGDMNDGLNILLRKVELRRLELGQLKYVFRRVQNALPQHYNDGTVNAIVQGQSFALTSHPVVWWALTGAGYIMSGLYARYAYFDAAQERLGDEAPWYELMFAYLAGIWTVLLFGRANQILLQDLFSSLYGLFTRQQPFHAAPITVLSVIKQVSLAAIISLPSLFGGARMVMRFGEFHDSPGSYLAAYIIAMLAYGGFNHRDTMQSFGYIWSLARRMIQGDQVCYGDSYAEFVSRFMRTLISNPHWLKKYFDSQGNGLSDNSEATVTAVGKQVLVNPVNPTSLFGRLAERMNPTKPSHEVCLTQKGVRLMNALLILEGFHRQAQASENPRDLNEKFIRWRNLHRGDPSSDHAFHHMVSSSSGDSFPPEPPEANTKGEGETDSLLSGFAM